jgi:hypothetical protein
MVNAKMFRWLVGIGFCLLLAGAAGQVGSTPAAPTAMSDPYRETPFSEVYSKAGFRY